MAQQQSDRTFKLNPSWKAYFWPYLFSVLAIPIVGIGLIALYFVRKNHKRQVYKISDTQISKADKKYQHNVDLADIDDIELQRSWMQEKLDIGTLVLHTSASKMELIGLEEPQNLLNILEQAVESEKERHKQRQKTQQKKPDYQPGNMERMDYLTGLWQQGLISEEDYEAERKNFE